MRARALTIRGRARWLLDHGHTPNGLRSHGRDGFPDLYISLEVYVCAYGPLCLFGNASETPTIIRKHDFGTPSHCNTHHAYYSVKGLQKYAS